MEKKTAGVIIVLVVVVLLIGAVLWRQPITEQPSSTSPQPVMLPDSNPVPIEPVPAVSTAETRAVLMFPAPNATKEEKDRHNALVDKLAVQAAYLDLTRCVPQPLVLAYNTGENLTIKNQDQTSGIVFLWGKNTLTILAGKSAVVKAAMIGGPGNIGYACYLAGTPQPPITTVGVIRSRELAP